MSEQEVLWLQNDALRVELLPAFGGKITSLRSVRTGEEFLLPPLGGYYRVSPFANFSESDGGGFDECLPSVAACEGSPGQSSVPDHGDLWRLNWDVDHSRLRIYLPCIAGRPVQREHLNLPALEAERAVNAARELSQIVAGRPEQG